MKTQNIQSIARNRTLAALAALALVLIAVPAHAADGVVNLNSATEDQLALLPRVGPAIAERILEHRESDGDFAGTEELMLVRGIGEKTYDLLAPWIAVEGDTTLTDKVSTAEARARLEPDQADERR